MEPLSSRARRHAEADRLLDFAARSVVPHGFAWLDDDRRPDPAQDLQIWINARMAYVFSCATLLGREGARSVAEHGVRALTETFADPDHGGWFHRVAYDGSGPVEDAKDCYDHAFVVLAGSAATAAGVPGAEPLLADALAVHAERFWDGSAGACRERWSADWSELEPYRGANSNMHTVEAYLLAADVTGDEVWRDRARSIVERIVLTVARDHDWRVVEHFSPAWDPLLDYNTEARRDPFRPYGATPGHGFEWSRLVLQLDPALLPAAESLFARALADTAGGEALLYTTDWSGNPIVTERFHWVLCEAILAAETLAEHTAEARYADLAARWWDLAATSYADPRGSWHHELDADLRVSRTTWAGKPDAYHAFNALVLRDVRFG